MIEYALGILTGLVLAILNMLFYKTRVTDKVEQKIKSSISKKASIVETPNALLDSLDL